MSAFQTISQIFLVCITRTSNSTSLKMELINFTISFQNGFSSYCSYLVEWSYPSFRPQTSNLKVIEMTSLRGFTFNCSLDLLSSTSWVSPESFPYSLSLWYYLIVLAHDTFPQVTMLLLCTHCFLCPRSTLALHHFSGVWYHLILKYSTLILLRLWCISWPLPPSFPCPTSHPWKIKQASISYFLSACRLVLPFSTFPVPSFINLTHSLCPY